MGKSLNILQIPKIPKVTDLNTCYLIDCMINGEPMRGYVVSGYDAVKIPDSDAVKLDLDERVSTLAWLQGFAGGTVNINYKVSINVMVVLASADVETLLVHDYVKNVSIIEGEPFVNHDNVTVVIQVRLYSHNAGISSYVNILPSRKIDLYAADRSSSCYEEVEAAVISVMTTTVTKARQDKEKAYYD